MKLKHLLLTALCAVMGVGAWAQKDITSTYITNATLSNGTTGWTVSNFNTPKQGVNTVGYASECYAGWGALETSNYSLKQNITLPAGSYRLVNYSFYRSGAAYNTDNNTSNCNLYAGDTKVAIKTLGSITAAGYANSQDEGANCFDSKMYRNVVEFTIAEDNTSIEIGLEGTHKQAKDWVIAGMFELFDLNQEPSYEVPTDMTYAIVNPGFEYRNLSGWVNTDMGYHAKNVDAYSGNGQGERWQAGSGLGSGKSLKQTITGLPNGVYDVKVKAQNIEQYNSDAAGRGMYLVAGANRTEISGQNTYTVRTTTSNGQLSIGLELDGCTGNWVSFDCFELWYCGVDLDEYKAALDASRTAAKEILDGSAKFNAELRTALQDAYDETESVADTRSDLEAAMKTMEDALTDANNSIAAYEKVAAINTKAASLDAAGQTAYAATLAAYNAGTLTKNEEVNQATTAYIGAVKAQTSDNADMTDAIVNAGCDGGYNGWNKDNVANCNNNTFGDSAFEFWGYNFNGTSTFDYNQTINGLPNGTYKVSALMYNDQLENNEKTFSPTIGVYASSGASEVRAPVTEMGTTYNWYETSETVSVVNGTIKIGVKNFETISARWFVVDAFKLTMAHKYTDEELEALKYSYTINAVDADDNVIEEISSGKEFANTVVYYPHAIEKDGTWYLTTANTYAATITEENQVVNVTYVADPDIIYYSDGEGSHANQWMPASPANYSNGNVCNNMASNAGNAQDRGLNVCNLSAGTYIFTAKVVGTNKRAVNLRSSSTIITSLDTQTEGVKTSIFTLDEDKTNLIINGANNGETKSLQMQEIDYFYISRLNMEHLEKAVIKDAKCDNNDGWPGGGRTTETMVAYDGQNRTVFSSNTYTDPATKAGQRSQAIKLPFTGAYKLTTYCKIAAETGYVAMWVDNTRNFTNKATADRMQADANGWVANEIYFTANADDSKTIYINISKGSGDRNYAYAYVSGVELAYLGEADANASMAVNSEAQYGTFCAPFAVNVPVGVTASTATIDEDGTTLVLEEVVGNVIPANTPVILNGENGLVSTALAGNTVAGTPTNGALTGTYERMYAPLNSYILQNNEGNVGFYLCDEANKFVVAKNRCYLTAPESEASPRAFFFGGESTAVETISALVNNEVKEIYNVNGVKQNSLQKGMNIVKMSDGSTRKIMVK